MPKIYDLLNQSINPTWQNASVRFRYDDCISLGGCDLKLGTGDAAAAVGGFFDVDEGYFDATAALGGRLEGGDVHVIGDAEAEAVVIQPDIGDDRVGGIGEAAPETCIEDNGVGL